MRKLSFITVPFIATSILITGCGGGTTTNTTADVNTPPAVIVTPVASTPSNPVTTNKTVSLLGVTGKSQVKRQTVNGENKPEKAIVDKEFSNAVGQFIYSTNLTNVIGNLTFGVTVEEPNSITDISIYLPSVQQTINLCSTDCGISFNKTITGFNPQLSGIEAGTLRAELFVTDSAQNTAMIDVLTIDWRPIQISAINATRENGKISVNWQGESSLNRYNVYAATEPNISSSNALTLENGIQFLALTSTEIIFNDTNEEESFYLLITGIDEGGESGLSSPIKINSNLIPLNKPPQAVTDTISVDEDTTISTNILINDVDPENQPIILESIITQPSNGVLTFESSGDITYSPNPNFNGKDTFSYQIVDNDQNTSTATVSITINNINDAPVATNDAYNLDIDNTISITSNGLLVNDSDIDGDFIFVEITPLTQPKTGVLQLNTNGSFTYAADNSFINSDTFDYQITDNNGGTSSATVTVLSSGTDTSPTAVNDSYNVDEDKTLEVTDVSQSILANDIDPNGLEIQLNTTLITTTTNGVLNLSVDGTFTYIPNVNYYGIDEFQYEIENTLGKKSQAFVHINVNSIADIPIANNDIYQTNEDTPINVTALNGVLINDSDPDLGAIVVNTSLLVAAQQGQVSIAEDGGFIYTPVNDFNGIDTFTYQISNNKNATNSGQVSITVRSINDAPQAINDSAFTTSDVAIEIDGLANDVDIEGDSLDIINASSNASYGNVLIQNKKILFTPLITFSGLAEIDYTITDPSGGQSSAKVLVSVTLAGSNNTAPVSVNDTYVTAEDTSLQATTVLANDTDIDGDTLQVLTTPSVDVTNGTLSLLADGTFSYAPNLNFNGADSFTYKVSDGEGGNSQATVTLTINAVNDNPTANDDNFSTLENTPITIISSDFNAILKNDIDEDGDSLAVNVSASGNPSSGTLLLDTDGEFTYTPNSMYVGSDSFTYQTDDGNGGSASATVTITVINTNDAPMAKPDNYNMVEDDVLNASSVLDNDTDADGDTLTIDMTFTSSPTNGVVVFSSDGTFEYTPNAGYSGADSFTYKVKDGNGESDEGLINIAITPNPAAHGSPLARNDNYSIDEDTSLVENSMLNNDNSDQTDNSDVTFLVVDTAPVENIENGTLILGNNGSFIYTPDLNFNGIDFFEYKITSIYGKTSTAQVKITVNPINDAPIANDDSFSIKKNSGKFTDKFLLDNDSDPEGSHLDINETPITDVSHGTLKLKKHGDIEYTPDTDYVGFDTFTYELEDDDGDTDQATVTITITEN